MVWKIIIPPFVEKDFKHIPIQHKEIILETCRKKLSVNPEGYGKPLGGNLHGFWKLKILEYRVIYQVRKNEVRVVIVKVGFRRDAEVYRDLIKMLDKLVY